MTALSWIESLKAGVIPDGVYVDVANGVAGTDWPIGTSGMPVNNLIDAFIIAAVRNTVVIRIAENYENENYVPLPTDLSQSYMFVGVDYQNNGMNLNGKNPNYSVFLNLALYGIAITKPLYAHGCWLWSVTIHGDSELMNCLFDDTTKFNSAGSSYISNPSFADTTLDFDSLAVQAILIGASGKLTLAKVAHANAIVNIYGKGLSLIIASSCTVGTINIYGDVKITNNSGGAIVNDYTDATESAWKSVNGVYINGTEGVALGTYSAGAAPVGLPNLPVTNFTDAKLIAAARKLSILYLVDTLSTMGPEVDLGKDYTLEGIGWNVFLNGLGKNFDSCVIKNIDTWASIFLGYNIEWVNCKVTGTLNGHIFGGILRDIIPNGYIWVQDVNALAAVIDCSDVAFADFDLMNVFGYVTIKNYTLVPGNGLVFGNGLVLTIDPTCTAGVIQVYGDVKIINNSGGTVVNDFTNKPKAEVAVNINAINASETNFLNLATAGFHYTIDKIRLKCADPGENTVTVRLYELVNGVSTLVDSFDIATANFATYHSVMDMFGVNSLAGDNLKITVQASAEGPYAVTGSYAYRSA